MFSVAQPRSTRRRLIAAGLIAAALLAGPLAAAAAPPPAPLSADDQALVDQVTAYIGGMGEMKGRFVQTDARGGVSGGVLFLKRPGRARFAYDPPSSQLMVSDGAHVSISDPRLKTFSRYPLGATPLSLFLAREVRLDRGVQVTHVDRFSDGFALTARDVHHPKAGTITLTFADQPVRLREWSLTDAQGQTIRIRITALEPTSGLDPALFVLRDPRAVSTDEEHP
jgi:outer membrane lipoprotein-sorting protein